MQGATGLFIAALATLLMLALTPFLSAPANAEPVGARAASALIAVPDAAVTKVSAEVQLPSITRLSSGFHNVDETASSAVSFGTLGMCLLAALSVLLVATAFILRSAQGRGHGSDAG